MSNYLSGNVLAMGLVWNLLLATIPLFWSAAFQSASKTKNIPLALAAFLLWLLFLPNAPYLITDIIHLNFRPMVPLWWRVAILASFAGTGTLYGYLSLLNVQGVLEAQYNKAVGWAIAVFALMGSGYGIYLGRFLRWNSWDAITHPFTLIKSMRTQFVDPGPLPHPIPVTLVFGIGLIIGYMAIRVMSCASPQTTKMGSIPA